VSQIAISLGKQALDTTGTVGRLAFIACNAMFAELFAIAGIGTPQIINVGTYSAGANSSDITQMPIALGEETLTAFAKINQNFTALFAAAGTPALREVILQGGSPGMIAGQDSPVIGTGDPARVMWFKVNANFTYLYAVL
jgi:hypothetical protein